MKTQLTPDRINDALDTGMRFAVARHKDDDTFQIFAQTDSLHAAWAILKLVTSKPEIWTVYDSLLGGEVCEQGIII